MRLSIVLPVIVGLISIVQAIWLDTNDVKNLKEVSALIAEGLLDYYDGNDYGGTIGMFTWPYYWWEAGGAWGSLIDYTYYMENDTFVPMIKEALEYQTGEDLNYIPLNQSTTEGNDDQGFWGLAVMSATEKNFSNPKDDNKHWLALTQAVFNTMTARWDHNECHGGLRWQIFQWNSGYDYKNSVSNGCLFNLGARLARYTSNDSYMDWAEEVWNWMYGIGLLKKDGEYWFVYDGVTVDGNCSDITKLQWTYNQGLMLSGCAVLYNYTEDEMWYNRTMRLLTGAQVFFKDNVMYEAACQNSNNCNQDQRSFKAYFSRFLGLTSIMVPDTEPVITEWLVASANAAAKNSCTGGDDYHTCGLNWNNGSWDGEYGLGEQMSALEVITNLRVHDLPPPYTADNGGSSKGDPAGGYAVTNTNSAPLQLDTGDKAGAGIITVVIAASLIGSGVWLIL